MIFDRFTLNTLEAEARRLADAARVGAVVAARWTLDAVRGYARVADGLEGVASFLATARAGDRRTKEYYAGCALDALRAMGETRAKTGGMGAGARLALSPAEWVALRIAAEELRAEALGHPVDARAEA